MWPFKSRHRTVATQKEVSIPEICRIAVANWDRRLPYHERIGERGARKAAIAGQRIRDRNGGRSAEIDAIEKSLTSQYQSKAFCAETEPSWIERYLADEEFLRERTRHVLTA